jgi:methionyl-tRNA formyltransferase
VYTQPDRAAGRGRKLTPSAVKQVALAAEIPVLQPQNLKAAEDLAILKAFDADLMVVVAYGLLLPQVVLDTPRLGCINVHASLLPRWRGAAPIQRALMAGDSETGVTIMKMVLKLDAGDMLHKETCTIEPSDTASELHDRLAQLGAKGLQAVLPALESGTLMASSQDESQVTYAQKLSKSEATLDWTQPARQLALKVRGLNAWPVAQTLYQHKVLRIWRAIAISATNVAEPGTVMLIDKRHMDVTTGQGSLRLQEIQLPGGKRMNVEAFLNAHNIDGVRLGV